MFFENFNRMKNKKGFSLVEMIVVVAIIAIMSAVAVPNFISSYRRSEGSRQNEHARGFYFALQSTLLNTMENDNTEAEFYLIVDGNITRRSSPSGSALAPTLGFSHPENDDEFFFLSVEMGVDGRINRTGYIFDYTGGDISTGNVAIINNLFNEIEGYLAQDGEVGYYYAMFDNKFRVVMAYYSRHITDGDENYVVTGTNLASTSGPGGALIFGAYPFAYSFGNAGNPLSWFDIIVDEDTGAPI